MKRTKDKPPVNLANVSVGKGTYAEVQEKFSEELVARVVDGSVVEGGVVTAGIDDADAMVAELLDDAVSLVVDRFLLIELAANSEATAADTEAKGTVSDTSL